MPAWWSRLTSSPRSLAAVGAGVVVVVAVVATVLAVSGGDDDAPSAGSSSSSSGAPGSSSGPDATANAPKSDLEPLPPDRDTYCPAYRKIQQGGLTTPGGDEDDDSVDLAELSKTFSTLLTRYTAAERVSPLSLRDDYAQTLGYLRQGKKAADSQDVGLLRALVTNLDSLNDSMSSIQAKSAQFCS